MIDHSTLRVLVLDDEPVMLKLLSHLLRRLGFSAITTSDDATAALALIDGADGAPDLIVLDLNMPVMDGMEFVRHLAERSFAGSLILVSGEDRRVLQTANRLVRAHSIELLGHLVKPVGPGDLAALVEGWLPRTAGAFRLRESRYDAATLQSAIEHGELVSHYQPKVRVADGSLAGFEALVRWNHPQDGLVYPDDFIGLAEHHGLIDALSRRVLVDALQQLRRWQAAGLDVHVAVNVSMHSFATLDFADFVIDRTHALGINSAYVVLEVTESQLMQDLRTPLEVLSRLRLRRFGLSIDDFGTGHSSLAQLRDIPFNELKVDRGFVHRACTDSTLRAIYDASLGLAKQLDMEVVAEGVEDKADWELLTRTGCDLAQGYFIGRPMAADALDGWHQQWERTRPS